MSERKCPYTGGVQCIEQVRCCVCGWNPAVARSQQEKLREPKPVEKGKKKSRPSGANTGSGNLHKT